MEIKEIKEQKEKLQDWIKELVMQYEVKTSTSVNNISLIRHSAVNGLGKVMESVIEITVQAEV